MPATSVRDWALSFTPAVLLVVVATLHQYRTAVSDQSWWGRRRRLRNVHDRRLPRFEDVAGHPFTPTKGAHRVAVNSDSAWRARVLPTQSNIDALADELLDATWSVAANIRPDEPRYTRAEPDDGGRVEVHRRRCGAVALELRLRDRHGDDMAQPPGNRSVRRQPDPVELAAYLLPVVLLVNSLNTPYLLTLNLVFAAAIFAVADLRRSPWTFLALAACLGTPTWSCGGSATRTMSIWRSTGAWL